MRLSHVPRVLAIAATLAGLSTAGQATTSWSALFAFGDSLSDNGNFFGLSGDKLPQPQNYANGRFSNGIVAVEYLGNRLGLPLYDYAFGGSGTGVNKGPLDLPAQLGMLNQKAGPAVDPNGLYFVWSGANDVRDLFKAGDFSSTSRDLVIDALGSFVSTLYQQGARSFLLPLLPDLGLTPEGQASGAASLLSGYSLGFNTALKAEYQSLNLAGAQLTVFDTLVAQRNLVADAAALGFTHGVNEPCFTGYVGEAGTQCSAASESSYIFWDKVHPTTATHAILGAEMAALVPEPSSTLLLAVGSLALLGWARRRG
jgi:outer membrane lipase/esterase